MWFIKCRTAQAAVGLAVEAPGCSRPLQSWVCTGLGRGVSRYVCEDLRPTLSLSPTKEPATSGRSALLIQVAREATLAQAWTPKWGVTQAGTEPLSWIDQPWRQYLRSEPRAGQLLPLVTGLGSPYSGLP